MHFLPPLLAFGILHLPMLGWLVAAAAPILIYWWSRRHYRETPWAAMEFLLAAVKRQRRRLLVEEWFLLMVRTAIIILIVLAVAEPFFESAGLGWMAPAGGNAHRVLVVDGSYSMDDRPTDKTRFERAKELLRQIVEQSPPGDAFSLVLMASPPRAVVEMPTLERAEMVREIENLDPTQTGADLAATIEIVRKMVDGDPDENARPARNEVFFLTDLQRATWLPKRSAAASAEWVEETSSLAKKAALYVIDLGQPGAENLAVTDLHAADPTIIAGRDVSFVAELKNFGRRAIQRQPVEWFVDGRRIERRDVDIGPDGTASVQFTCRFDTPADHRVEVRAPGDALEVDNHRFLAVPVRQAIRVLCIDGRPSGKKFQGAADYLAAALMSEAAGENSPAIQAEVARESALSDRNLHGYDVVFLSDVAQFTGSEARVLDAYLHNGGGLVFLLGEQVLPERYNGELGNAGQGRAGGLGWLPAAIGPVVEAKRMRLDPLDYRHPMLQPFRGRGETTLATTPVFKYFKLDVPKDSPAKTVLAMSNGDPLVVESSVDRGRVVLVATGVESSWSALPLWPSFVPLVREMVAQCAQGPFQQRNLLVGDPLNVSAADVVAETSPSVQTPDGGRRSMQNHAADRYAGFRFARTEKSGFYVVHAGLTEEKGQTFAVNVDTVESDLARVEVEQLRGEVWPGVPFIYQASRQDFGSVGSTSSMPGRSRLHVDLLYVVLGLVVFETFLSWRMGAKGLGMRDKGLE